MIRILDKLPARRRTRSAAIVAAVAASAATLLVTAPVATAAPADPSPQVGITSSTLGHRAADASYFPYRHYFYARSALVEGTLYASGCVRAYASTYAGPSRRLDYKSTSLKCNTTVPVKLELQANIPGGADRILVELRDSAGNLLDYEWEYR